MALSLSQPLSTNSPMGPRFCPSQVSEPRPNFLSELSKEITKYYTPFLDTHYQYVMCLSYEGVPGIYIGPGLGTAHLNMSQWTSLCTNSIHEGIIQNVDIGDHWRTWLATLYTNKQFHGIHFSPSQLSPSFFIQARRVSKVSLFDQPGPHSCIFFQAFLSLELYSMNCFNTWFKHAFNNSDS